MIDPKPESQEIETILARANLSRMRGNWEAATDACMDALCHDPHNVAAHSLLGDIHADQNKLDDAIQWYCIALDLQPDSLADRSKLLRAIEDRKRELVDSPRKLATAVENLTARLTVKTGSRSARTEKTVRAVIFLAAILMLSAIAAAPLVIQYRNQSQQGFSYKASSSNVIEAPPVVLNHLPGDNAQPSQPTTTFSALLSADPFDQTLLMHLRANPDLKTHDIEAVAVESDPRTAKVVLTFVALPVAGSTGTQRGAILRNALLLAQAANIDVQPNPIAIFTIRALAPEAATPVLPGTAPAQPTGAPRLAFMGDVAASDLRGLNVTEATLPDTDAENRFTSVWWSAAIA